MKVLASIAAKKQPKSKPEKMVFQWKDYKVPLLIGCFVTMGILVGLIPQLNDIFEIRSEIKKLDGTLKILDSKYQALTSLPDAELNSMVSLVEAALPSDKPIFQAIEMVQTRAFEYGLVVDSFDFSPGSIATQSASVKPTTANPSGIASMDLEVSLVGTFENLLTFVEALENSGPITEVQGFSVSSAQAFENEVKTTIGLKIFYMSPPTNYGGVTSPLKLMTPEQITAIESLATLAKVSPGTGLAPANSVLRDDPFTF